MERTRVAPTHEDRRNLVVVTLVCLAAVVLTLVLAACGVTAGASEQAAGARHAHGTKARDHRPTKAELLAEHHARDAERLRTAVAYTTTTTRPPVSPFGPPPDTNAGKRLVYRNSCQTA